MTFRDQEKARYQHLKGRLFSSQAQPAGVYFGRPREFCLADGCSAENLHTSLRAEAIEYFEKRGIGWHHGCGDADERRKTLPSNHLCCSQSACVNALAPMMRDAYLLTRVFSIFLPELSEPLSMTADDVLTNGEALFLSFEWIGTENYLGERGSRTRGANATSADFALRFRRHDGRIQLVLGEWKYTEEYNGKKLPEKINPTRFRTYRKAFNRWDRDQSNLPPYEAFFVDPFYQLMRLILLAREMERARDHGAGEMEADVVSVVHIAPMANTDFSKRFTSPVFAQYGSTVTEAWAAIAPDGRFAAITSESLLTAISHLAGEQHREWADWLITRYGWWRAASAENAEGVEG
jgi:hypothetical protein